MNVRDTTRTSGIPRRLPARQPDRWTRSALLRLGLALPAPVLLAACGGQQAATGPGASPDQGNAATTAARAPGSQPAPAAEPAAQATPAGAVLQPTLECADADDVTPPQTEGPYFKPNSPPRTSLIESGIAGTRLVLTGRVLGTDCRPIARALVDFWQADSRGQYDNVTYRLRGHQFTDAAGQYRLETIVPGLYPGRTRHIHVKVQAPNRPVLTTQLYFPNEPANRTDSIFHPDLVIEVASPGSASAGMMATFDFVLQVT